MKPTTTRFILATLIMISCLNVQAQSMRGNFPDMNEMRERKWKLLSEQAKLTPEEIAAVKPVFLEYEQAVWQIHQERHKMGIDLMKNRGKSSVDYNALNDRYINAEIQQAQLLREYHLKLKKLLQPETLFNYYRAERMFKRKLLRNMPPPPPAEK